MRVFMQSELRRLVTGSKIHRFLSLMILDSWKYVPLRKYLNFRKLSLFWKVCLHAQQNWASLSSVYDLTTFVENSRLPGALVECGVWRGGCAAVMATVAAKARSNRKLWLFDSFEGMPEATQEDLGEDAKWLSNNRMSGRLAPVGRNVASINEVRSLLFNELHLETSSVMIVKGWFQNTLPEYQRHIGPVAILRIDGDWYESTRVCLENLYDNVVAGGFIIIDDYGFFPGCRKAVDEFVERRALKARLTAIDYSRVYFRKC